MPFAIGIKSANETARPVRDLWNEVSAFEVAPSMAPLGYPPHITLAVYDRVDIDLLADTVRDVFADKPALRLTFNKLRNFEGPPLVLWAAPTVTPALRLLHARLGEHIDMALCREQYRPAAWVPHCTLGTDIQRGRKMDAMTLCAAPMASFDVTFDVADCVSFPPVRVIQECKLVDPD